MAFLRKQYQSFARVIFPIRTWISHHRFLTYTVVIVFSFAISFTYAVKDQDEFCKQDKAVCKVIEQFESDANHILSPNYQSNFFTFLLDGRKDRPIDIHSDDHQKLLQLMSDAKVYIEKLAKERRLEPLAIQKLNKETKQNENIENPKLFAVAESAYRYFNLQKRIYLNYLKSTHQVLGRETGYSPNHYEFMNLKVYSNVATVLMQSQSYMLKFNLWHIKDEHGSYEQSMLGLTPQDKDAAEEAALRSAVSPDRYLKLLKFYQIRENITNYWGVSHVAEGVNLSPPSLNSCGKELLSFSNNQTAQGNYYDFLMKFDRYDEFTTKYKHDRQSAGTPQTAVAPSGGAASCSASAQSGQSSCQQSLSDLLAAALATPTPTALEASTLNHPVLDDDAFKKMVHEFYYSIPDFDQKGKEFIMAGILSSINSARKKNYDLAISNIKVMGAEKKVEIKLPKELENPPIDLTVDDLRKDINETQPKNIADMTESHWAEVVGEALANAHYPADVWTNEMVADRTVSIAFEERKQYIINLLAQEATQLGAYISLNILETKPEEIKAKALKLFTERAKMTVDKFIAPVEKKWKEESTGRIIAYLNSDASKLSDETRKQVRFDGYIFKPALKGIQLAASAKQILNEVGDLKKNDSSKILKKFYRPPLVVNPKAAPQEQARQIRISSEIHDVDLAFIPSKLYLKNRFSPWTPDQLKLLFDQKVGFWIDHLKQSSSEGDLDERLGEYNENTKKIAKIALDISNSKQVNLVMKHFFSNLANRFYTKIQDSGMGISSITPHTRFMYEVLPYAISDAYDELEKLLTTEPKVEKSEEQLTFEKKHPFIPYQPVARSSTDHTAMDAPKIVPQDQADYDLKQEQKANFIKNPFQNNELILKVPEREKVRALLIQAFALLGISKASYIKVLPPESLAMIQKTKMFDAPTIFDGRVRSSMVNMSAQSPVDLEEVLSEQGQESRLENQLTHSVLDQQMFAQVLYQQVMSENPILAIQETNEENAPPVLDSIVTTYLSQKDVNQQNEAAKNSLKNALQIAIRNLPGRITESCNADPFDSYSIGSGKRLKNEAWAKVFRTAGAFREQLKESDYRYQFYDRQETLQTRTLFQAIQQVYVTPFNQAAGYVFTMGLKIAGLIALIASTGGIAGLMTGYGTLMEGTAAFVDGAMGTLKSIVLISQTPSATMLEVILKNLPLKAASIFKWLVTSMPLLVVNSIWISEVMLAGYVGYIQMPAQLEYQLGFSNSQIGVFSKNILPRNKTRQFINEMNGAKSAAVTQFEFIAVMFGVPELFRLHSAYLALNPGTRKALDEAAEIEANKAVVDNIKMKTSLDMQMEEGRKAAEMAEKRGAPLIPVEKADVWLHSKLSRLKEIGQSLLKNGRINAIKEGTEISDLTTLNMNLVLDVVKDPNDVLNLYQIKELENAKEVSKYTKSAERTELLAYHGKDWTYRADFTNWLKDKMTYYLSKGKFKTFDELAKVKDAAELAENASPEGTENGFVSTSDAAKTSMFSFHASGVKMMDEVKIEDGNRVLQKEGSRLENFWHALRNNYVAKFYRGSYFELVETDLASMKAEFLSGKLTQEGLGQLKEGAVYNKNFNEPAALYALIQKAKADHYIESGNYYLIKSLQLARFLKQTHELGGTQAEALQAFFKTFSEKDWELHSELFHWMAKNFDLLKLNEINNNKYDFTEKKDFGEHLFSDRLKDQDAAIEFAAKLRRNQKLYKERDAMIARANKRAAKEEKKNGAEAPVSESDDHQAPEPDEAAQAEHHEADEAKASETTADVAEDNSETEDTPEFLVVVDVNADGTLVYGKKETLDKNKRMKKIKVFFSDLPFFGTKEKP